MAFQIFTSQELNCSGQSYQSVNVSNIPGTAVSIGFQNSGNATDFYASQMFVNSPTSAYVQVVNTSFTSTGWWVWVVYSTPSDAKAAAGTLKLEVSQGRLSEAKTK